MLEISLEINKNQGEICVTAENQILEENVSDRKMAEMSIEIETVSNKDNEEENQGLVIVYRLILLWC